MILLIEYPITCGEDPTNTRLVRADLGGAVAKDSACETKRYSGASVVLKNPKYWAASIEQVTAARFDHQLPE